MSWRPLSRRGTAERVEEYDALHEGIPPWLQSSIVEWVAAVISALGQRSGSLVQVLRALERKLRLPLDWRQSHADVVAERSASAPAFRSLMATIVGEPERGLDVVDYLLSQAKGWLKGFIDDLDDQLREAGSKWCVSVTRDGLEERVASEVAARAIEAMTSGTRAAAHLSEAWQAIYGRNPNPSHAYREAVRAVEVATIPIVSPTNGRTTLGTVIRDMKAAPSKRTVAFQPLTGDPVPHIIATLELLWTGEFDRHGTADESVPLSVSREQAEAAVHLALTLTHWFQSGAVQ